MTRWSGQERKEEEEKEEKKMAPFAATVTGSHQPDRDPAVWDPKIETGAWLVQLGWGVAVRRTGDRNGNKEDDPSAGNGGLHRRGVAWRGF